MNPLERFSKWLQLKIYQLEVTLSVYIFTPVEKFIFYSVIFLLFSLTFIATVLYLPQHVAFIIGRAWFYMNGDGGDGLLKQAAAQSAVFGTAATTAKVVAETTTGVAREL